MVSSYITKISLAIALLAIVFVIGIWILANPPQPDPLPERWAEKSGIYGSRRG